MRKLKKTYWAVVVLFICVGSFQSCFTKQKNTEALWVELGRHLFYDTKLSVNNTRSCGTCHNPSMAFTDGYKRSIGAYADVLQRNSLPLFNLQNQQYFTAADSTLHAVHEQMNNPLFRTNPIEMGLELNNSDAIKNLLANNWYSQQLKVLNAEANIETVKKAIASFVLQIQSYNSAYDNYLTGDSKALAASQKAGKALFFSNKTNCYSCHGGKNFNSPDTNLHSNYFNTGLYNINNSNTYPLFDVGLAELTKNDNDNGKYKVPTLRNLVFTAPYYHDGSAANLNEVIDAYAAGGRNITTGEYKGKGTLHKNKHPLIKGFTISGNEKIDLINFLYTLTDSSLVKNPQYKNPF
jgi:cytochrome c peroxidase